MGSQPDQQPLAQDQAAALDRAYWNALERARALCSVTAGALLGAALLSVAWLGAVVRLGAVACAVVALLLALSTVLQTLRSTLVPPPWRLMGDGARRTATLAEFRRLGVGLPAPSAGAPLQRVELAIHLAGDGNARTVVVRQHVPPSAQRRLQAGEPLVVYVDRLDPENLCVDWSARVDG